MYFTAACAAGTSVLLSMLAVFPSVRYPTLSGVPVGAALGVPRADVVGVVAAAPVVAEEACVVAVVDLLLLLHAARAVAAATTAASTMRRDVEMWCNVRSPCCRHRQRRASRSSAPGSQSTRRTPQGTAPEPRTNCPCIYRLNISYPTLARTPTGESVVSPSRRGDLSKAQRRSVTRG